jgi:hypothetical protein
MDMTAAELITQATADGVILVSVDDRLKVTGPSAAVARWAPQLRQFRAELVEAMRAVRSSPPPAECVTPSRLWLIRHADGRVVSHSFCPPATETEVRAWYPQAIAIEPEADATTDEVSA